MGGLVVTLVTVIALFAWRVFLVVFGIAIESPSLAECDGFDDTISGCADTRASLRDILLGTIPGLPIGHTVNVLLLGVQGIILVVVILFYARGTT